MLIQASQLVRLPVGSLDEETKIGEIYSTVIDRNQVKIVGFLIKKGTFFSRKYIISGDDIIEIDKNGLVIRNSGSVVAIDEILRTKKIIDDKFNLFGLPVRFKRDKKHIGKISDFLIESETLSVVKFYMHGLFEDRVFTVLDLDKIEKDEIIFKNDLDKKRSHAVEEAVA